jgi:membrane protein CcdC involved in cytochrome C biogenesis
METIGLPLIYGLTFCIAALILYLRYRRHIGPQLIKPIRMKVRVLMLCGAAVFILASPIGLEHRLGVVAALAAGAVLGVLSLRHTHFEVRADRRYYIPNLYIGLAITALFASRMIYRFVVLYAQLQQDDGPVAGPQVSDELAIVAGTSLLTQALIGVIIGYYASYYVGVLMRRDNPT